jgi:hypothetical protein
MAEVHVMAPEALFGGSLTCMTMPPCALTFCLECGSDSKVTIDVTGFVPNEPMTHLKPVFSLFITGYNWL